MKGLPRLKELQKEVGRIQAKIQIALELGVDGAVVDGSSVSIDVLRGKIKPLLTDIGRAAMAEAVNEIKEAQDEAARIGAGKGPKKSAGPGDKDGDDKGTGRNGGGGAGAPGAGAPGGGPLIIGDGGTQTEPNAVCVYTRSDESVWAWDRREQEWKLFNNGAPVVKVDFLSGGLLVITKAGAALFDCGLGEWLTALDSGTQALVDGEGRP